MAIELKQQLRLSQQLVMTPQLQQAIKLLQLSRLELVDMVQQELQENPVLEEVSDLDEDRSAAEDRGQPTRCRWRPRLSSRRSRRLRRCPSAEPSDAQKIDDIDWQSYTESNPQTAPGVVRDDDERRSLEATHTRRETLSEHLEWQLQLADL